MSKFSIQVRALFVKNLKIYFRNKKSLLKDLLLPIITAIYIITTGFQTQHFLPEEVLLPISLLGHVRSIMVDVVTDKSDKYKENLKINGLTSAAYHFSTILFAYFKVIIFTVITCFGFFITKAQEIQISAINLTLLYFCAGLATTHLALFLTNFFQSKELSADLGGFIFTILSFSYLAAAETGKNAWYYISMLFPQNSLSIALMSKEDNKIPLELVTIYVFLLIDSIMYLLLYFYLDEVLPDQFGVKKNWNYCVEGACAPKEEGDEEEEHSILQNYMEGSSSDEEQEGSPMRRDHSSALYHQKIQHAQVGSRVIQMVNVHRSFGADEIIKGLSLNFFEKEVFCLLGHNGAGKTTIINMLTGILDTNNGGILYYQYPLKKVMEKYREQIGLCNQIDVLYKDLTVYEHLQLFGKVKGLEGEELEAQINKAIQRLDMGREKNKLVRAMSGGNKRKLSLALAILGDNKIIFLDEPTSGLDPQSRRFVWDLITALKEEGRTIILTTHHLDEAEHLADRLAIMTKGNLFAVGTPNHIKKKFGIGYHLTITPDYESPEKSELKNVKEDILRIIEKKIPDIKCDEETLDTLKYLLPFDKLIDFPSIFEQLEEIPGIKLSLEMNSLEDAFVNIGLHQELYTSAKQKDSLNDTIMQEVCKNIPDTVPESFFAEPKYSFRKQFKAMFMRKYYATLRNYKSLILIALPILFVVIGVMLGMVKLTKDEFADENGIGNQTNDMIVTFTFLFLVNFAFALNSTVYASFPVLEREKKIKYVLRVLGCRTFPYWAGTFAFDMLLILGINLVITLLVFVLNLHILQENLGPFLGLMIIYSFAIVTTSYLYGFLYDKVSTVYKSYAAFYFFALYILPAVLIAIFEFYEVNKTFQLVFKWAMYHLTPLLPFNDGLIFLILGNKGVSLKDTHFLFDSLNDCILFIVWQAFLFGVLTIIVDRFKNKEARKAEMQPQSQPQSDQPAMRRKRTESTEVVLERERVEYPDNDDPVKVLHLIKNYPNGFKALKDISFGVASGEIFGLLGPNGAGKSTTFNIVTGMIPRTKGTVLLNECHIDEDWTDLRPKMGICPQFNALWDSVEVEEHLKIYGNIKGLDSENLKESVDYLLKAFQMENVAAKKSEVLSGGTKRKLATAISLINAPQILFLDEPSTGMDPTAKRCFWSAIRRIVSKKMSSVILTTHSMEEAEVLCRKIGILVNGKFMCFGPMSFLKDQYGSGYKVDFVKTKENQNISLQAERLFPDGIKLESHMNVETYQVPTKSMVFSKVFQTLEGLKMKKIIADYSIYNTTLEQVFITFAKIQMDITNGDSSEDLDSE